MRGMQSPIPFDTSAKLKSTLAIIGDDNSIRKVVFCFCASLIALG